MKEIDWSNGSRLLLLSSYLFAQRSQHRVLGIDIVLTMALEQYIEQMQYNIKDFWSFKHVVMKRAIIVTDNDNTGPLDKYDDDLIMAIHNAVNNNYHLDLSFFVTELVTMAGGIIISPLQLTKHINKNI